MTRFSVFIPVYNGGRWLPGAIESVVTQDHEDWELVIGDNASDEDLVACIPAGEPRIRYHRWPDHVDIFENFNRTYDLCEAEWTFLLPADDRLLPGCLRRLAEVIESEPDVPRPLAAVFPMAIRIDPDGHPVEVRYYGYQGRREVRPARYDAPGWARAVAAPGSAPWDGAAYRTSIIETMGHFYRTDLSTMSGDLELSLRIAAYGDVMYVEEPLMAVTAWPGSHTHGRTGRNRIAGERLTTTGAALIQGYGPHVSRGVASADGWSAIRAAIARSYLRRAAGHRYAGSGSGRRGAILDVARAIRISPRTMIPGGLPRALGLVLAPSVALTWFRERALSRRERAATNHPVLRR